MDARTIANFLQDIQANSAVMRQLGNPTSQLTDFIAYLSSVASCDRTFIRFTLADQTFDDYPYMQVKDGELTFAPHIAGIAIDARTVNIINNPTAIFWETNAGLWWVTNYRSRIVTFDENFSFKGGWGQYGTFTPGDIRYLNLMDIYVNDNIVLTASANHFIQCFDRNDSTHLLWDFGGTGPGHPSTGRLYWPYGITYNPANDTVLVASNGIHVGNGYGLISEHDAATGAYIRTILEYQYDGMPWNHAVSRPYKIDIIQNPITTEYELWICYYNSAIVGVFRYDAGTNEYEYDRVYGYSPAFENNNIQVTDIVPIYDEDVAFFALQSPDRVGTVGLTDSDIKGFFGVTNYEGITSAERKVYGFYDLRGIAYNGLSVAIVDYTNNKIVTLPADALKGDYRPIEIVYTPDRPVPEFHCEPCLTDKRLDWTDSRLKTTISELFINPPPKEIYMAIEVA